MPKGITLDELIKLQEAHPATSRSAWLKEPGFSNLYCRVTSRYIDGGRVNKIVDIANVEAKIPGMGAFKALLAKLETTYPEYGIYIENTQNLKWIKGLVKRGFRILDEDAFKRRETTCLFRPGVGIPPSTKDLLTC